MHKRGWPGSVDPPVWGAQVCKSKWARSWGGGGKHLKGSAAAAGAWAVPVRAPRAVGCGSWALTGAGRAGLFVYGHEERQLSWIPTLSVPLCPPCHEPWKKSPLLPECPEPLPSCGSRAADSACQQMFLCCCWGAACREHLQPLPCPLPTWASLCQHCFLPPHPGNWPGRVQGHTVTAQESLWKNLKPQVLHRNLKDSHRKPFRWKKETGHISAFSDVTSPPRISLCQLRERKGNSEKSKQHLFVTIQRPVKQVEIFCPLLWDAKPISQTSFDGCSAAYKLFPVQESRKRL